MCVVVTRRTAGMSNCVSSTSANMRTKMTTTSLSVSYVQFTCVRALRYDNGGQRQTCVWCSLQMPVQATWMSMSQQLVRGVIMIVSRVLPTSWTYTVPQALQLKTRNQASRSQNAKVRGTTPAAACIREQWCTTTHSCVFNTFEQARGKERKRRVRPYC